MDASKRNRYAGTGKQKRDLKKAAAYEAQPHRKAYRVELNRQNRKLQREGKAKVGDGKDVSHRKPAKKGGTLKQGYRLEAQSKNRARNSR